MNCQHGPTESVAPPTVSSKSFTRAMDQQPTADTAVFVIFSLFHFYHTPLGTKSHFDFCFYLGTWNDNEGRGEYMTLLCADWTYRKLSGENDSWKLGLQLKPFRPFWVRPTLVGGDWEVNKQQVNQQYSPVDTVSSRPRWGERQACNSGDVTRPSHGKTLRKFMAPIIHLQILPSQQSHQRQTSSLKTFSATVLSQKLTTWINLCWKDLHQPYPKMPSTTNNYQVFLCCTKNTMSVSLRSPEFFPLSPPPTSVLFLPVCSSLDNILSDTWIHRRSVISWLPVKTHKDCDMAFRCRHSQCY